MKLDLDWIVTLLIQITLVSGVSLGLAAIFLRRRPAARHALLASALVVIATSSLWIKLAAFSPIKVIAVRGVMPMQRDEPAPAVIRYVVNVEPDRPDATANNSFDWLTIAWMVWVLGVIQLSARQCVGWMRARRDVRNSTESVDCRDPGVRISDCIPGPMSVGLIRPVILIPSELVRALTHRQLQQVIEHEQAHALRGDHLIATLQQLVGIFFWPHPLIHALNWCLDRAREETCDNAVLSNCDASEYARTLLQINEWMSQREWLRSQSSAALALLGRPWTLQERIEELLDKRRNRMTRAHVPFVLVTLMIFAATALLVSCARVSNAESAQTQSAAASSTKPSMPPGELRPIEFTIGDRDFFNGDDIQITQVRCTTNTFMPGEIIEVTGTYNLQTTSEANLHLYLTASANEPHAPELVDQGITVKRGEGEFRLREMLSCVGLPHVTFYSNKSGKAFGGVYFGEGVWLLAHRGWQSSEKNATEVAKE